MGRSRCDYWYCGREWLDVVGGLSRCGGRKCGGSWREDGGCRWWWWWMGMLCCAVLCCCCCLHAESQPKAHTKDGRDRASTAGRRKLVPEGLRFCALLIQSLCSVCFLLLLLLLFTTKTTNSNHRLCRPTRVDTLALATPMDRSRANCHF